MAVSKRLRFEVLRRDDHTCRYCGAKAPDAVITIDHVVPVSLGGADTADNLVAACKDCNAGKSSASPDSTMVAMVGEDNARWRAALDVARHQLEGDDDEYAVEFDMFDDAWTAWRYNDGTEPYRPHNWRQSVLAFIQSGLSIDMVVDLVPVAMAPGVKDPWRYLCGCAWRRVSDVQELAVTIMQQATEEDEVRAEGELVEKRVAEGRHVDEPVSLGEVIRRAVEAFKGDD